VLQVTHDGQSTRMPIDLKAAVPGLPKRPVRSRAAGPLPRTLAIGGDVQADASGIGSCPPASRVTTSNSSP